ncbi:MAG: sterol desaturase family protein [Chthoniobacterales bacterium]
MPQHFVSNRNESVRMFESDFLEFFSHVHPITPLVIYVPVMSYLLYLALAVRATALPLVAALFVAGILIWSFVEYFMHRWIFHYEPRSTWGKRLHFMLHGVHHDYPNDASRLVMPPSVSIPLAILFYGIFFLAFGRFTPAIYAGFLAGYLFYDSLHYATHHFAMKRGLLLWLKRYHMRHHYQDEESGFGVTSPLWDYAFGTNAAGVRPPAEDPAAAKL